MRTSIFVVLAAALFFVSIAAAVETPDGFDMRIESELQRTHPELVLTWHQANAARAAGLHNVAANFYAQVYARAPKFVHALRREAYEESQMGQNDLAEKHYRDALAADRSTENLTAIASFLMFAHRDNADAVHEAKADIEEALKAAPDDPDANLVTAEAAGLSQDWELLDATADRLLKIAPKNPQAHMYAAINAGVHEKWSEARSEIDLAKKLGLDPPTYEAVSRQISSHTPFYLRWWMPFTIAIAAWIAAFAILLLAGAMLSRTAMRAAREVPSNLAENATTLSSRLRKTYAAVLTMSSAFYYVSVPIVILLVLLICGGAVYASLMLGHIPVKLIVILLIVGATSIWSMLKSLFIKPADVDPGQRLDLERHPRLRALLDDVAAKIGTRAVDNVYLTPATELAVMQRGKHQSERCLILGVAALDGLKMRPFKAVLGHEYGHFVNRDTAGGAFALSVRRSLNATAYALAAGGAATWYNPAWHFVRVFNRVFLRISEGASRLQEVLADRWAVFAYGADAFEQGLRHVVERSIRFDAHASATLKEVVDGKLALANLYTYQPTSNAVADEIEKKVAESLNREASAYDSHPSPAERFALVHALPPHGHETASDDDEDAWTLFDRPEELQLAMTTQVRANVAANYGITILAPA